MAIWDRVKDGLDKANRVAQDALDEGKLRIDIRRTRQSADKAAEALGYAVFRAWESGQPLAPEVMDRLARALREHEQEAARLEQAAPQATEWRKTTEAGVTEAGESAPTTPPNAAAPAGAPEAGSAPRTESAPQPESAPQAERAPQAGGAPPAGSPQP